MVSLEALLFGGAISAFGGTVWMVATQRRVRRDGFVALADRRGWDHRSRVPPELLDHVATVAGVQRQGHRMDADLYLAGPAPCGPFQMVRSVEIHRGRPGGWTFVHLRVAKASPGVRVVPAPRFVQRPGGRSRIEDAFARRFEVQGEDGAAASRVHGARMMAMLLRPGAPVRIGWAGHDLVVAFPVAVASPGGAETLLRYAGAVAEAMLSDPDGRNRQAPDASPHASRSSSAA